MLCVDRALFFVHQAITYWVFREVMILRSQRHHTEEEVEGYRLHSRLTIKQVKEADYGAYKCVSKNSLGETEGQIRLYGKLSLCPTICSNLRVYLEIVSESTSLATTFTPRQTRSNTTDHITLTSLTPVCPRSTPPHHPRLIPLQPWSAKQPAQQTAIQRTTANTARGAGEVELEQ